MTYRIEYTAAARRDLVGIGNYIREQAGDLTAERLLGRIIDQAENLQFMPQRYRARDELQAGLRAVSVGKYLVFYRVAGDTVSLIRVLHGARNITPDLFTG